MSASKKERALALGLALARLAFCGYRAVHQSVTADEAWTYLHFVQGSWATAYARYDANNHFLHTLLVRLSVTLFGAFNFALRLPSLVGGFVLMLGVYAVLELVCSRPVRWIALLALSLNPLILDLSVAARGYGLGLALFTWALYTALRKRYWLTGVLLGLAAAANLTMAFPVAGLMGAVLLYERRFRTAIAMAAPAAFIFAAISLPALPVFRSAYNATGSIGGAANTYFYAGARTIFDAVVALVDPSLHSTYEAGSFATGITTVLLLPLLALFILWASLRDRKRALPSVTLLLAIALAVAAHVIFGLPYPADRMGLYLILLFVVCWAVAVDSLANRTLRIANAAIAALLLIQCAAQLQTRQFYLWFYDRDARGIAQRIAEASAGHAPGSMRLSASWLHQASLEYYRQTLPVPALQPIRRDEKPALSGYDFYVLNKEDAIGPEMAKLHVLFTDPPAGVVLASSPE